MSHESLLGVVSELWKTHSLTRRAHPSGGPLTPARQGQRPRSSHLDTTDEDRRRKINRSENLRPIAVDDEGWHIVGGPRSRAEALNSKLKHFWANRRIPAVGIGAQLLFLLGFGMALNWEAQQHYDRRTGALGPPGTPPALSAAA